MNKDNAKQFLPLVQALADKKQVQQLSLDGKSWKDIESPMFNRGPNCYRIKPEPRRIWVNEYECEAHYAYDSKENAQLHSNGMSVKRIAVEYVEVMK